MARYTGFSTNGYEMNGTSFKLHDVPLIAHDLTNEIYTSIGEKIHQIDYGTRIPIMTFELGDENSRQVILDDVTKVISHDPRVRLEAIDMIELDDHTLVFVAKVYYIEFNVVDDLYINF